jgi:choline-glycine betaine transporter
LFVLYIFFSKYGKIKLGKDDEEPEFSDMTYFTMLFAAGVGIGLFYFGVAEPVIHYDKHVPYANRYWGR